MKFAISLCSNKRSKKNAIFKCATTSGAKNSSSKKLARLLKHLPGGVPWPRGDLKKRTQQQQQLQLLQPAAQGGCGARAILRQKDQPYSVGPQEDSRDGPEKCPTWQARPCSATIRERSLKDHDHDAIPPPIKMTDPRRTQAIKHPSKIVLQGHPQCSFGGATGSARKCCA